MTLTHNSEPLTANRVATAALAAVGAASAIPIPLSQLDFAGLIGAGALLLGAATANEHERIGNLGRTTGVDTRTPRRGEI